MRQGVGRFFCLADRNNDAVRTILRPSRVGMRSSDGNPWPDARFQQRLQLGGRNDRFQKIQES